MYVCMYVVIFPCPEVTIASRNCTISPGRDINVTQYSNRQRYNMGSFHSRLWKITLPVSLPLLAFVYLRWKQMQVKKIELFRQVGYVSGLFIYPVKSCAGIELENAVCFTEGIQFDRYVEFIRSSPLHRVYLCLLL